MEITISNEIRIQNPVPELVQWVRRNLTISNPEYLKKQRMGMWTGKTDPQLYFYYIDGDCLVVPCGVGKQIRKFITPEDIVNQDLANNSLLDYEGNISLYDYQKPAVEEMKRAGCGILQSPCGSGKTQMGIALAALIGRKTLWVTHTQDLLTQSYDRAKQYFKESTLGKITAGKVCIGTHITFATVQTLSKMDLEKHKYTWDVIIVDECHRVSGTPTSLKMFYHVISRLAARYKYGLSATVHRSDGLIKSTFAILGEVQYKVPDAAVASKTMQVRVLKENTGIKINRCCLDTDGTLLYSKLIPYLTDNIDRNQVIADDLIHNKDHFNLILSDRLEHLRFLMSMLPDELRNQAVMIDGKMTSKKGREERIQAIEDMKAGKKHYLFASYSLAKEGLDIPRLDHLYLTTPKKDYAVVTQSIGRIARVYDGKLNAICHDYVDDIQFCENQWKRRKTSYRKAGCIIFEQS